MMAALEFPRGAVAAPVDPDCDASVELRRLRWRARRGMLENDLLLGRFLERHAASLGPSAVDALAGLLELPDGQLLDLVLGRVEPQGALDRAPVHELLARLRAA
ncbi:YgfY (modular protein) [Burkholderiales bacterium]|nr:YgfY (modular protein) [Burkholderiales bacterium]